MSDYYDAWSANKRKKSLGTNASSSRLRRQQQPQHQQQSFAPATTTTTTPATVITAAPSSTTATRTSPGVQFVLDQLALPLISFSPALPRHPTTTTHIISFKAGPSGTTPFHKKTNTTSTAFTTATGPTTSPRPRPISAWRFSRTIFDSSLRPSSNDGPSSYVTDFDDVGEDDDDEDDDDDDEEDDEAESDSNNNNALSYSHVSVIPRIQGPTPSGTTTTTSTAPNSRNPLKWSGAISTARPTPATQVQQPRQVEHGPTIEQLDTLDERLAAVYSPYTSLARSSPALSEDALLAPADHPQSTTTFNTRLYSQPILQHLNCLTDQQGQTRLSLAKTSVSGRKQQQGRRPRPWSQVIWESPFLGEGSQSNQHQQQSQQSQQQRVRDHLITVGPRPDTAYPALRKDMFTPASAATEKDKERVMSKSVRINIDGDVTSTTTAGSTTYPSIPAQTGDNGTGLTPKRELSHGRKTMDRISLGPGFYASIEPISLSTATPSTPKTRRQLVRLPARPQSVLIPSTAHHFPISGSGNTSGRLSAGLQPISTDQFKRRRHKSQQLEMRGDSQRAIAIPWQQLAPMGAQDNAKTFHGIGFAPATPIPILKKGGSQENTFGATTLYPLNEAPESVRLPPASTPRKPSLFTKPNAPYMHLQHRSSQSHGQGLPRFNPSPPTSAPTSFSFSSSSQQSSSSHTPSWFLPALLETSSSYLFKKALPSSTAASSPSSSSPKRSTFGLHQSGSTPSPTRILSSNSRNTSSYSPDRILASSSHLHYSRPQQQPYRHFSLQTRQSLPTSGSSSSSSHYHHDSTSNSYSSSTGNQGDSLLKKSRRKLTASLTPTSFFSSITSSNSNSNNDTNAASNSHHQQQQRSPVPVSGASCNNSSNNSTTTTKTSLWKRNSSSVLFPFSLVSYESGGLLGEVKNTSTTICTNASSSVVAPGTPLPPGVIVSTGVSSLKDTSSSSSVSPSPTLGPMIVPTISIITPPAFPRSPGSSSTLGSSRSSTPTRRSRLASEVVHGEEHQTGVSGYGDGKDDSQDDSDSGDHEKRDSEEKDEDDDDEDDETTYSDEDKEYEEENEYEEEMHGDTGLNGSIVIQKSHVAVYEINARWGSRLMMFLVTLGGIFCALSGGLCAEHHCKDLQLCPNDYQTHGDWCGPSGVEGAPYMLTVGLSMCTFGLYAMTHLRSPISRLVGYSEIDQFL